jgi:catechol 2,3-dioxygenase-like lactoylglutathione lyase family enzyme
MLTFTASHAGLCVADLDRSMRFYTEGLGFAAAERYEIAGEEFAKTLEVEGDVAVVSQFIRKETMAIELLGYNSPGTFGTPLARRNHLGLTHLSFYVDNVADAAAHLVAHGGRILESTHTKNEAIELLFLEDPDGTRIELMAPVAAS